MKRKSRHQRFEPVTVRAAARVLHLGRTGRLAAQEAHSYVRRLATLDSHAGSRGHRGLSRLALRRSCLGHTGVPSVFQMTRRERKPADKAAGSSGRLVLRIAA